MTSWIWIDSYKTNTNFKRCINYASHSDYRVIVCVRALGGGF